MPLCNLLVFESIFNSMAIKRNKPSHNKITPLADLQYNNSSNLGGIYSITNKLNQRKYVGSTFKFKNRWSQHLGQLRKEKHYNKFLQNDFIKSGEENYVFEILEIVEDDINKRLEREQFYLDELFQNNIKDLIYNNSQKSVLGEVKKHKQKKIRKRIDWYWLLSSDGIEYVVENLDYFCKTYKLDYSHINKVASDIELQYKGWTKIFSSTNNTLMNKITSQEVIVTSITNFSIKHGVDQSHITKLFSGKRKTCGGWVVKNRVIFPRAARGKTYKIMNEQGNVVKFNNLELFAKKNNIKISGIRAITAAKKSEGRFQLSYKQFTRYPYTKEDVQRLLEEKKSVRLVKPQPAKAIMKTYHFLNPSGQSIIIQNMKKFCKENDLTSSTMFKVNNGTRNHHKGWTKFIISE